MSFLRVKPKLSYNGLTVVLSNPSRFDKVSLLTSTGGRIFHEALQPEFNQWQCDLRIKEDKEPLLPGTKCVLLLGEHATHYWLNDSSNTIGAIRGSVIEHNDVIHIPSFFPQEAADIKDYEGEFNSQNQVMVDAGGPIGEDKEEDAASEKRRHGRTKRNNYAFWLRKDIAKAKYILKHGRPPARPFEPEYVIYPPADFLIKLLTETKNQNLFIDLETDEHLNVLCFAFSFGSTVYVVPCFNHNYEWGYSSIHHIYRALAIALRDNCAVAHNGAAFDFFVLASKLHIPIGKRVKDTMIMHHRCFPEVEKSLGHCTSLWTWEPFHKDEGGGGYNTIEACRRMWAYCGKDVYTMILVHNAIMDYAKKRPGLTESIEQANDSIRPYLTMTLQGIKYQQDVLEATMKENDELMMQYLRMINLLVGEKTINKLRTRFKSALPSSNPQCCEYFHNMLGYPVVGRGKMKKDGTRGASLAKKNMFKLKLKFDNPVIDLCIAYRETAKESGSLKFNPWKEDDQTNINEVRQVLAESESERTNVPSGHESSEKVGTSSETKDIRSSTV